MAEFFEQYAVMQAVSDFWRSVGGGILVDSMQRERDRQKRKLETLRGLVYAAVAGKPITLELMGFTARETRDPSVADIARRALDKSSIEKRRAG